MCQRCEILAKSTDAILFLPQTATAGSIDFSSVTAPTRLHACYSPDNTKFYTAGRNAVQVMVTSFQVTAISPQTATEGSVLRNVALDGLFCPSAPKPTMALSTDPQCPLASLMAKSSVTGASASVCSAGRY